LIFYNILAMYSPCITYTIKTFILFPLLVLSVFILSPPLIAAETSEDAVPGNDIATPSADESAYESGSEGAEASDAEPDTKTVKAVRLNPRFKDHGDGTITDTKTGLMWMKDANINKSKVPWQTAKEYIEELNKGIHANFAYKDWRLPKVRELASVIDSSQFYPALPEAHPFENVRKNSYYWTSSGGFNIVGYVWVVDMASGNIKYDYVSYCNFQNLWPVRSTKKSAEIDLKKNVVLHISPSDLNLSLGSLSCDDTVGGKPVMAPVGVSATAVSSSDIVLSWQMTDEDSDVAWFNVYEDGKFVKSTPETMVTIRKLNPKEKRCYTVSSFSNMGLESQKTSRMCATTWTKSAKGTVWSEGINDYGQLGDGTTNDSNTLILTSGLEEVVRIVAGAEHSVAVKKDGTVWTWGRNLRGQLGNGSLKDSLSPGRVEGLSGIVDIAAGWYHTMALKKDGTVWTWGRNYYGQLGNGRLIDKLIPVQVKDLANVKSIGSGWYHSIAVKKDGTVWTWGWNRKGQLGVSDLNTSNVPVQVLGLTDVKEATGGEHHSLALNSSGEVWAWGWNKYGQLGSGNKLDSPMPVRVRALDGITRISGGMHYSMTLKNDGSVWAWGRNEYGQLGSASASNSPVRIAALSGIKDIAAGAHHGVALDEEGFVSVWGWNYGNKQKRSPPKKISGVPGNDAIAAGMHFTVAVKE
jgi:alpha-tubulin suppressor-like RCC1 family protein